MGVGLLEPHTGDTVRRVEDRVVHRVAGVPREQGRPEGACRGVVRGVECDLQLCHLVRGSRQPVFAGEPRDDAGQFEVLRGDLAGALLVDAEKTHIHHTGTQPDLRYVMSGDERRLRHRADEGGARPGPAAL